MSKALKVLKILTLAVGVILLASGAASVLMYLLLPFYYHEADLLSTNLTIGSVATLSLTVGAALTYQARSSLAGRPSRIFRPTSPWLLALIFLLCLLIGQAVISLLGQPTLTSLVFPPIHVLAATCPALTVLALVARRLQAASWRTVSVELAHGAILAPTGALAAEIIVLVVIAFVISFIVALTPGGMERLLALSNNLRDPAWVEDPANLAQLVLSPWALTLIVIVFVIVAPLIEEFLKGLGVLFLSYRLKGPAEALVWGVACGAGFALAESLFNGSIAVDGWAPVMVMRWGASLMHCVGSAILGLGWHQALVGRRPWRLVGALGASTGIHALWNGAAVAVAVPSLLMVTRPQDLPAQGVAGLVVLTSLAVLVLLSVSMALLLGYLIARVRGSPSSVRLPEKQNAPSRDNL